MPEFERVRDDPAATTGVSRAPAGELARLRAENESLRLRVAALEVGFRNEAMLINQGDRIVFANEQALKLLGAASADEVLGRTPFDFFHPDYHDTIRERLARLHGGEAVPLIEEKIVRLDGRVIDVEVAAVPVNPPEGPAIQVLLRDISARKRVEARVRESRAALQGFYDSSPFMMGVGELDGDTIVSVEANRATAEFFKVPPEGLRQRTSDEIGSPREAQHLWLEQYRRCRREGRPVRFEYEHMTAAGPRWLRATAAYLGEGAQGRPQFSFVAEDITEQKQVEAGRQKLLQQVEEQRARLQTIIDSLPVGLWITDSVGRMVVINDQARDIWGGDAPRSADVSGFEIYKAWWPGTGERIAAEAMPLARALRGETCSEAAVEFERFDGSRGTQLVSSAPIRSADGAIIGAVAIVQDITQHQRTEKALRESEHRLSMARMAAGLGIHDWNISAGEIHWDDRVRELWGIGPDEPITYESFMSGVHPDDRTGVQAAVDRALDPLGGGLYQIEYRVISRRDGGERWVAATGHVTFRDGRAVRLIGTVHDITRQKRSERALAESEARFRMLADNIPQLAWIADPTGSILWYNRRWFDYTGTTLDEMKGWGWQKVHHPDHVDRVSAKFRTHIERGQAWEDTFPLRGVDGEYRWFLSRAVPIRDGAGAILRWFGTNTDITEQRRYVEALGQSEALFRTLGEAVPDHLWMTDGEGDPIYQNPAWERYTGLTCEQLRRAGWAALCHPEDVPRLRRMWAEANRMGSPLQAELRMRRRDGEYRWFFTRTVPLKEDDGRVTRWVGTSTDIDSRKRAEEQLRAALQRLDAHMANSPLAIIEFDSQVRVIRWSDEACRLFGWTAGEVTGKAIGELRWVHEDDVEKVRRTSESMITGRAPRSMNSNRNYRKDGSIIHCEWYNSALYDATGNLTSILSLVLDVTQRTRAQQDLIAAKAAAESANAAKDQFLAVLSHELRTPLTPVLMLSQQLAEEPGLPESARQDMVTIRRNIQLEARLIDDLLDLTRIARGKIQLKVERVSVHDLLRHAMETCCDEDFIRKGLRVDWNLVGEEPVTMADPARLEQVFWNMLRNAVKFTSPGGRVTISTDVVESGHVQVSVCDDGVGIEPEKLTSIFSPFEQGGWDTTRQFGGLGLGLAIAKAVMDLHGGRIWAESPGKGRGATFRVVLPLAAAAPSTPLASAGKEGPGRGPAGAHRPRVLLVEDHLTTAMVLQRLMGKWGWDVVWASSCEGALRIAAERSFELVVSDLGLPDGTGHDLMIRLRDAYGLQGIALSGYGMEEDVRKSLASGFILHLTKPLNFEELRHAVVAFLAGAEHVRGGPVADPA